MAVSEKRETIQKPLYALFRQLYKGPLYETPDFCFQKCVDNEAEVFKVGMQIEEGVLVGASILKIIPTTEKYDGKLVSLLEVTSGYLPAFRSNLNITPFVFGEMIAYKRKNPDKLLCLCDLMTSPVSYMLFFRHPFLFYPRYDVKTPEKIEKLLLNLIRRMPQYCDLPQTDPLVKQGAKPREMLHQYYARLMRGAENDPHIQYYYERTQGVLGWGLFVIQLIEQSAAEIECIVNAYILQRGDGKKAFQFTLPLLKNTDFNYLVQLRNNKAPLKNKTLMDRMPQNVSIKWEVLNSQETQLIFYHHKYAIFEITVPTISVDSFVDPSVAKFVEMILQGDIDVQDKMVINLCCGSGAIGIAAILMGADKVLFSDANEYYLESLKKHPLINNLEHAFVTQALLTETLKKVSHEKYDFLLVGTPDPDDDFFKKLISQSSKILKEICILRNFSK